MQISPAMAAFLKHYETGGKWDRETSKVKLLPPGQPALTAYPDSGGIWTIGWGHTGKKVGMGCTITLAMAEDLFRADAAYMEHAVETALAGMVTKQCQFDAMVSLTYNIGPSKFRTSTLLQKQRAGDYAGAADQFNLWTNHGQEGAIRRRAAERAFYLGMSVTPA